MLILVLLGMYFDAAVLFVTKSSLLFRLAVSILCVGLKKQYDFVWPLYRKIQKSLLNYNFELNLTPKTF